MTRNDLLNVATRGDVAALAFLTETIDAFHTWDDLIDQDKPVTPAAITAAFHFAFVGMPTNAFYAEHFRHLFPIVCNAITNWLAANEMERQPTAKLDHEIAFITRSEYVNLIIETARLCGGHAWAQDITADIRRFSHSEGFDQYLLNLSEEKERRDAQ